MGTVEVVRATRTLVIPAGTSGTRIGEELVPEMDLSAGRHTVFVRATDSSGNTGISPNFRFAIAAPGAATEGAPGTPVFTEYYDIAAAVGLDPALPWQMSFDKFTQTVWLNTELGTQTIQFDPATGALKVYDLSVLGVSANNPHGVFFDFDTHVNPRVWIVHRDAGGPTAPPGAEGENGRLTYLDIRNNRFVTYDFATLLEGTGVEPEDLHAVVVDAHGTVWMAAAHSNQIFELHFVEGDVIDVVTATITVHTVPPQLSILDPSVPYDPTNPPDPFDPHGLDVIVDETTGEVYFWAIAEGGSGRVALLRPNSGPDGSDVWTTWDVADQFEGIRGTFVEIDDNETPGNPHDDRVILTVPVLRPPTGGGGGGGGNPGGSPAATRGVIHVLDPGHTLTGAGDPPRIRTYVIPAITGSPEVLGAPNQPYVDREGTVFFIDRLGSVGRFDPDDLTPTNVDVLTDPARTITVVMPREMTVNIAPTAFVPIDGNILTEFVAPRVVLDGPANTLDRAALPGLDQYEVAGVDSLGKGQGAFRGFLNATNVLYGSLAQNNALTTTIFAEAARRQMTVVQSAGPLPEGVLTEGRMAFQVYRNGSLVVTFRPQGSILDRQQNLTRLVAETQGIDATDPENPAFLEIAMDGDASAVTTPSGDVHVFGKNKAGGLVRYVFTQASGTWTAEVQAAPPAGAVLSEVTAFVDSTGRTGAVASRSDGHVVLYRDPGQAPVDLTALSAAPADNLVYGSVDVVEDEAADRIYIYGPNQRGGVVEYSFSNAVATPGPGDVTAGTILIPDANRPAGQSARDVFVFQGVDAVITADGVRHIFGSDGHSQLVHIEVQGTDLGNASAENVTRSIVDSGNFSGYFSFQAEFAGRVYYSLAPLIDPVDGTLYVYGTNAGDLVQFTLTTAGWEAANLTNDLNEGTGIRSPGNKVFGGPEAYITDSGDRHIFQINVEGEVVEYTFLKSEGHFTTQNVNLARGNSIESLESLDPLGLPQVLLPSVLVTVPQGGPAATVDPAAQLSNRLGSPLANSQLSVRMIGVNGLDIDNDRLTIANQGLGTGQIGISGNIITFSGQPLGTVEGGGTGSEPLVITLGEGTTSAALQALLRAIRYSTTGGTGFRAVEFELNAEDGSNLDRATGFISVVPAP